MKIKDKKECEKCGRESHTTEEHENIYIDAKYEDLK